MRRHPPVRSIAVAAMILAAVAMALPVAAVGGEAEAMAMAQPIIPAPQRCTAGPGRLVVDARTRILWSGAGASPAAEHLRAALCERTGLALAVDHLSPGAPVEGAIIFRETAGAAPGSDERYTLSVGDGGASVVAAGATGLFHGAVSLLQLAAAARSTTGASLAIAAVDIADQPRFGWRGLMLDESRHFFGKAAVIELLDSMAYLKLNRFHWHLTDEPGWRIEIKAYPRLTGIGAQGCWSDPAAAPAFYTQDDIRELVAYAAARHIMVIPEIDMPGHASAACRAYPELSGGGDGFTFNPGSETTYRFLEQVLTEVAALFPAPYLHLGGDEVHFGNKGWTADPAIMRFAKDHGLADAPGLERYFIKRMSAVVARLGKTTLGWDEVGASVPDATVMWWHHEQPKLLDRLLESGHAVVLCPRHPCYFDFVQHASHQAGRRWDGFNDVGRVYDFPEPALNGHLPADPAPGILGIEACLWTERIQDRARLGFMLYPRIAALAEACWTPAEAKDKAGFMQRLPGFLRELERRRIPYFDPLDPAKTPEPPGPVKKATGTANG
jgi:hexosaminidase